MTARRHPSSEHRESSTSAASPETEPAPSAPNPRLSADWAAVIVAALLVALALVGLLPSIPFLVK